MSSTFTWLDYSEHERRKMLDVIELFGERVTRDELGLAGVRDAFADKLFPGTSTIQTRARYFLFVPWTFLLLEEKRVHSAQAAERARKLEVQLIGALAKSDDHNGTIGIVAKENVRRLASSVYWQGLATWGIRRFAGSQEEYYRSLDSLYERQKTHANTSREFDGESLRGEFLANWHSGLPQRPSDFPEQAFFSMTQAEASYLREQVVLHCPGSLIAYLVQEQIEVDDIAFAWDLPIKLPPQLAEWVAHARNFSEIMHGAALLYNLMLAEACDWAEQQDVFREWLETWSQAVSQRHIEFRNWDRQRFWAMTTQQNPRVHSRARRFIDSWIDYCLAKSSLDEIANGPSGRRLVHLREQQLKGGLARLDNLRARELWQAGGGEAGTGQLDFRWRAASRIVSDILDGLE